MMEPRVTLADELRGAVRIPLRPLARLVILAGFAEEEFHETAAMARARSLKKRVYNARQWKKTPPAKRLSRAAYKAEWRRKNAERIRVTKRAWYHRNVGWARKLKRQQKREEYARNPAAARARVRDYRARKSGSAEVRP